MATFTCRCCGTPLDASEGAQTVSCPACTTVNAAPRVTGVESELLVRANRLRLNCEFDRAESAYQIVLMEEPQCHEALWGLLLCRYGVEFVSDPATGMYAPVVHFPRSKPLRTSADFLAACEFAPAEIRAAYEAEAARIDEQQQAIIDPPQDVRPYDVFLCFKASAPGEMGYSEDFNRAFQLYHMLMREGYSVFFAPKELSGAGASYEAAIYHALKSAKVMLLICSSREYIESPWVCSEWRRYLSMMEEGADKRLVPLLYGDLTAEQLPVEILMRGLQTLDMGTMSAAKELADLLVRCCSPHP